MMNFMGSQRGRESSRRFKIPATKDWGQPTNGNYIRQWFWTLRSVSSDSLRGAKASTAGRRWLSRAVVHCGRNRRVGEVPTIRPAAQMAGVERIWRSVQRVEFFSAGEGHDEIRQEKKDADSGDVFANSCYRFCRPNGEKHFATAESRCGSAVRPLRVHRLCARRGARNGSGVGSRALPIRSEADGGFLFSCTVGDGNRTAPGWPQWI